MHRIQLLISFFSRIYSSTNRNRQTVEVRGRARAEGEWARRARGADARRRDRIHKRALVRAQLDKLAAVHKEQAQLARLFVVRVSVLCDVC